MNQLTYAETLELFRDKLRIEEEFLHNLEKIAGPYSYALCKSRQQVKKLQKWVNEYEGYVKKYSQ